jgi:hypothetical protein
MSSFGTSHEHGAAVLEDPMANERTELNAAQPRLQATPVDPMVVDR